MKQIGDFVGGYTIRWADGAQPVLQKPENGNFMRIYIGTGRHEDAPPSLSESFTTMVGFTVIQYSEDGTEKVIVSSGSDSPTDPLLLAYDEGVLIGAGRNKENSEVLRVQLALYSTTSLGSATYKALYGVTVEGDPDDVAVWTADNTGP